MKIDIALPPPPPERAEPAAKEKPADLTAGLGDVFKKIRIARGLSQAEVGKRAGITGGSVQQTEVGKAALTVLRIQAIAEALDMELTISMTPKTAPAQTASAAREPKTPPPEPDPAAPKTVKATQAPWPFEDTGSKSKRARAGAH